MSLSRSELFSLNQFLNQCLGTNLLPGDITQFIEQMSPKVLVALANTQPDFVIRDFFPSLALSKQNIGFLAASTIVIKSRQGVYEYQHSRNKRKKYEVRLSFLSLFLLVTYGIHCRIMSTPNEYKIKLLTHAPDLYEPLAKSSIKTILSQNPIGLFQFQGDGMGLFLTRSPFNTVPASSYLLTQNPLALYYSDHNGTRTEISTETELTTLLEAMKSQPNQMANANNELDLRTEVLDDNQVLPIKQALSEKNLLLLDNHIICKGYPSLTNKKQILNAEETTTILKKIKKVNFLSKNIENKGEDIELSLEDFSIVNTFLREKNKVALPASHIGIWQNLANAFSDTNNNNFSLEISPPQTQSWDAINETLPIMQKIATAFRINPHQYFCPTTVVPFHNLQKSITEALSKLSDNVNRHTQDLIEKLSAKTYDLNQETDNKPVEWINNLSTPFRQMFNVTENNTVIISPSNHESPDEQEIATTFYNIFIYLAILEYSKNAKEEISFMRDKPYDEEQSLTQDPSNSLSKWLPQILIHAMDYPENPFTTILANAAKELQHHVTSQWRFNIKKLTLPLALFNNMLLPSVTGPLNIAMQEIAKFRELLIFRTTTKNTSTKELVKQLDHFFIRKLKPEKKEDPLFTKKELENEFLVGAKNNDKILTHIRPATMLAKNISIVLYHGDWQDCSGIMIIVPSKQINPLVGFKRPAYSHTLKNNQSAITGFPFYSSQVLRPQGGKALMNKEDMLRAINLIDYRAKRLFPDESRKAFISRILMEARNIYDDDLKEKIFLHAAEIRFIQHEDEPLSNSTPISNSFKLYQNIKKLIHADLIKYLPNKTPINNSIISYYLDYFKKLILTANATKTQLTQLSEILIHNSIMIRQKNAGLNLYNKQNAATFGPQLQNKYLMLCQIQAANPQLYANAYTNNKTHFSNEVDLSGLRLRNIFDPQSFICQPDYSTFTFDKQEIIQHTLFNRCGNTVAIYANVTKVENKKEVANEAGILQAMIEWDFLLQNVGLDLPFIVYNEKTTTYQVYDQNEFKDKYITPLQDKVLLLVYTNLVRAITIKEPVATQAIVPIPSLPPTKADLELLLNEAKKLHIEIKSIQKTDVGYKALYEKFMSCQKEYEQMQKALKNIQALASTAPLVSIPAPPKKQSRKHHLAINQTTTIASTAAQPTTTAPIIKKLKLLANTTAGSPVTTQAQRQTTGSPAKRLKLFAAANTNANTPQLGNSSTQQPATQTLKRKMQ